MRKLSILLGLGLTVLLAASASAQVIYQGPGGATIVPQASGGIGMHHSFYPPIPQSTPMIVTDPQFNGFNPQTGGINTLNHQLNDTAFDPYRHSSQFNGSRRWVQRPVYDTTGRVIGYEQGYVWRNSVTGVEHGNLQTFTPNGMGGVGQTNVARSQMEPGQASGVHTTERHYGPQANPLPRSNE